MPKHSDSLIYVEDDGTARELTDEEKEYVDKDFSPLDGARPFIKARYQQRNGWGELRGFLSRTKLPPGLKINAAPRDRPPEQSNPDTVAKSIVELVMKHNK